MKSGNTRQHVRLAVQHEVILLSELEAADGPLGQGFQGV